MSHLVTYNKTDGGGKVVGWRKDFTFCAVFPITLPFLRHLFTTLMFLEWLRFYYKHIYYDT